MYCCGVSRIPRRFWCPVHGAEVQSAGEGPLGTGEGTHARPQSGASGISFEKMVVTQLTNPNIPKLDVEKPYGFPKKGNLFFTDIYGYGGFSTSILVYRRETFGDWWTMGQYGLTMVRSPWFVIILRQNGSAWIPGIRSSTMPHKHVVTAVRMGRIMHISLQFITCL